MELLLHSGRVVDRNRYAGHDQFVTCERTPVRFARTAATAAAFVALLIPTTAHAAPVDEDSGDTITSPVRDALARLPVRTEDRTGYTRDKFKHWTDADKDGCNTRAEVLKAEAVIPPEQGPKCTLTDGEWYSAYDDRYIRGPAASTSTTSSPSPKPGTPAPPPRQRKSGKRTPTTSATTGP
ncbi:hypothetical protein [Streptomyces sp. NPDC054834]